MTATDSEQQDRLRELLAGRAEHLEVSTPYPAVRQPGKVSAIVSASRHWPSVAAAAAVLVMLMLSTNWLSGISSNATIESGSENPTSASNYLLVFTNDWIDLDSHIPAPRYRRDLTEQEFVEYWSDYPDVVSVFELTGEYPSPRRVKVGESNRDQLIEQLRATEGVVRVEDFPECDSPNAVISHYCSSDSQIPETALVLLISALLLGVLAATRQVRVPLAAAVMFIALAIGLSQAVLKPMQETLVAASPAVAEIELQYGSNLSCDDWYSLDGQVDFGDEPTPGRFNSIDPALVDEAQYSGSDIYLWDMLIVLTLITMFGLLPVMFFFSRHLAWKILAICTWVLLWVGIVAVLSDGAGYYSLNQAFQCMAE